MERSFSTNLFLVLLLCPFMGIAQTNLINSSTWQEGQSGSQTGFTRYGPGAGNIIEAGINPFGESALLWKATANSTTENSPNADGGWTGAYKDIDHTATYRLSVWVKKTNSNDGRLLLGMVVRDGGTTNTAARLDGTPLNSPYFINGDLPALDEWYYVVGFIYGSGHTGTTVQSAVYDVNGNQVSGATVNDFKFTANSVRIRERVWQNITANANDDMFFYAPALYEVNGSEPTVQELIAPPNSGGQSVWFESGTTASYAGEVAIGRNSVPAGYKLAIEGNIRTREIRVDQDTWPDYVFKENYDLPSLEEIKKHIQEKGHLPNMPSAQEVEENGIELGDMNRLLLEKIEEQMLHILKLEERVKTLENLK